MANTGTLGGTGTFVPGPGSQNAMIGVGLSGPGQGMDNTSAPDFGSVGGSGGALSFPSNSGYANLTSYTVSGFYRIPQQNSALSTTLGGHLFRIKSASNPGNPDLIYEVGRIFNDGNPTPDFSTRQYWGPTDSSGVFKTDVWVFFAMSYYGAAGAGNVKYYGANQLNTNVQLLATGTLAGPNTASVVNGIEIGNFSGIRPFDGLLDNVRLHGSKTDATGALSLSTLQSLADAGFAETLSGGGPAVHLATLVPTIARPTPLGAPGLSDIMLSSRWPRPDYPGDPYNTFQTINDFHATRLEWNYPRTNDAFITQIHNAGLTYAGTINGELPDQIGGSTRVLGRDKDMFGVPIHNPELPASISARGDINDPAYRQIVMDFMKFTVDAGGDAIMIDDPGMTYTNATDIGGGYGDVSLQLFRTYLTTNSTPARRSGWGMPSDMSTFNYANYAVSHNNGASVPSAVRTLFLNFHLGSLNSFYDSIGAEINTYAGETVPFVSNNGSPNYQTGIYSRNADFWIGETGKEYGNPTASGIYFKVKGAEALGKLQFFSPPNDSLTFIPTRTEYVALSRKIIATSYASGSATLVPWDVWRRGMDERFFGTVGEFGDLFDLIHQHPFYYDDHEEVFAVGAGVLSQRAPGLTSDPVQFVNPGSGQVFLTVRTTPGDLDAPIVVHMVDWANSPAAFSISLVNAMFGGVDGVALNAALLLPGIGQSLLVGSLSGSTKTVFSISTLSPYGMLVINPVLIPGDYDWDGDVDTADYQIWQANFGSTTNLFADGNGSGTVDAADYAIWRSHVGATLGGSANVVAQVPEPASCLLLGVAAMCQHQRRRRTIQRARISRYATHLMNCSTKSAPSPTDS